MGVLNGNHHDHLKEIARPVGADEQPTVMVFAGVFDCEGMRWRGGCLRRRHRACARSRGSPRAYCNTKSRGRGDDNGPRLSSCLQTGVVVWATSCFTGESPQRLPKRREKPSTPVRLWSSPSDRSACNRRISIGDEGRNCATLRLPIPRNRDPSPFCVRGRGAHSFESASSEHGRDPVASARSDQPAAVATRAERTSVPATRGESSRSSRP